MKNNTNKFINTIAFFLLVILSFVSCKQSKTERIGEFKLQGLSPDNWDCFYSTDKTIPQDIQPFFTKAQDDELSSNPSIVYEAKKETAFIVVSNVTLNTNDFEDPLTAFIAKEENSLSNQENIIVKTNTLEMENINCKQLVIFDEGVLQIQSFFYFDTVNNSICVNIIIDQESYVSLQKDIEPFLNSVSTIY